MEDHSSTHSFASLHQHHHPSLHLRSLQSPDVGHPSSLQQYQDPREESGSSSGGTRGNNTGFLNTRGRCLDGGHLDGEIELDCHFSDTWYECVKKEEVWDDGESRESAADDIYGQVGSYSSTNAVFYARDCDRANYRSYSSVNGAASETSHQTQPTPSCDSTAASSRDRYRSCSDSSEDRLRSAKGEPGPRVQFSPVREGWRGGTLVESSPLSINCGTYTQKLDSFSEAFLSQRKRGFPLLPSRDSAGQIWEFGVGKGENLGSVQSRRSCVFDADTHLPPSSASPTHPSPPTSSHIMSSVLSPPPTPLPSTSHSPSKMDSPRAFGGTAYSASQGPESIKFFASHLQPLPSVHSSRAMWNFPLQSHDFLQSSDDPGSMEANLSSSHEAGYCGVTATSPYAPGHGDSHGTFQSPETSFPTSSSLPTSRGARPAIPPSLHPTCNLASRMSGSRAEAAENTDPHVETQKVWGGSAGLTLPQLKRQPSVIYKGTPFPSILRSSQGVKRGRYTPRPLLKPIRRGTGLYASLSHLCPPGEESGSGGEEGAASPWVNVGSDFQAELPPCSVWGEGSEGEESPGEQLLWKPWGEPEESASRQEQVDKLLLMCSSSCLPGGGSNTELALHCLHHCQGSTLATLETLLLTQPLPTGDYRYSGSDSWTETEKSLFSAALETCGKDFSLIHRMVKTKTVCQCVEFYYLSKKLQDKDKKQKEEEKRGRELEQQSSATPLCQPVDSQFGLEKAVPVPPLATFFPCKLCGKMFYKIKSRNAHMKIHRQPQEDWADRKLQHQLLSQRLALSCSPNLMAPPAPALAFPPSNHPAGSNNCADNVLNSLCNTMSPSSLVAFSNISIPSSPGIDVGDPKQRDASAVVPFHQSWSSFGLEPAGFYCSPEEKEAAGAHVV